MRYVGIVLAAAVGLAVAGCSSSSSPGQAPPPAPTATTRSVVLPAQVARSNPQVTVAANIAATRRELARLITLTSAPPGATTRGGYRRTRRGPTLTDGWKFQTGWSMLQTEHWLEDHRPHGLKQNGTGSGGNAWTGQITSREVTWTENDTSYATELQIEAYLSLRKGGGTTVNDVASAYWLDPRPLPDDAKGPRIRVTVGGGCPHSTGHAVGVTNTGSDLRTVMLPSAAPSAGLICRYGSRGLTNNASNAPTSTPLNADQALALARKYRRLPLTHVDGAAFSCPAGFGSHVIVAFTIPGRPDVDLWVDSSGCETTANGTILAQSTDALGDAPL